MDVGGIIRQNGPGRDEINRQIQEAIRQAVALKPECHSFEALDGVTERKRMIEIGG